MTSHQPGACCYKGVKHEGEAKGEIGTLGDFEIYTKYPEDNSTEKGILMYVLHSPQTYRMSHTGRRLIVIASPT